MEIIDQLEKVKTDTLQYFDLPEQELRKTYGPDKWSVRHVLHHLADSESVLYYRIRRIISEPKQVIWVFDQEAWAKKLDYSNVPMDLAKSIYGSSRDAIIYYAGLHYQGSEAIPFVHSETGLRSLKEEFDKVVWHNQKHVSYIEQALRL